MRWPAPAAALLIAGLAVVSIPIVLWTVDVWLDNMLGGAAAGLLTVPICFVLSWLATRRPVWNRLIALPDRPGAVVAMAAVMIAMVGALVWAGQTWNALLLAGVLLPIAFWVWLWGTVGFGQARALTFPVAFAGFALPWEYFLRGTIDTPLQAWTADIALQGLRLGGYDMSYWNTYTIMSPKYFVIVNETCSGMNMLMTLGMYTLIFGWLVQPRMRNRMVLLALVFPIAMLANGARVAVIYLLGHYGGVPAAEGFWHTGSAYVIFLPVFWFIYVVNQALSARDRRHASTPASKSKTPTEDIHQSPQRT